MLGQQIDASVISLSQWIDDDHIVVWANGGGGDLDTNSVKAMASRELRIAMTTLDRQEQRCTTKIRYLLDAVSTDEG